MSNYNDGFWHGWNGGECPVHPDTLVDVMFQVDVEFRDGGRETCSRAGCWDWDETGDGKIVAFSVVKEHKEPREFWVDPNGVKIMLPYYGTDDNYTFKDHGYIHVREVIDNE